jgi:DNA integrity scanning protein DisA with diadenylate cyclase activity
VVAAQFHLLALDWLLSSLGPFLLIAFVVVFQPDLRRLISQIGRGGFMGRGLSRVTRFYSAAISSFRSKPGEKSERRHCGHREGR